jgi:gliding motility-associated-like protein
LKKIYLLTGCFLLALLNPTYSLPPVKGIKGNPGKLSTNKINWSSRDNMPGAIPAFQENKGQFPASAKGWKILYGCNYDGVDIYLTDKGIIYNISKSDQDSTERAIGKADPDENHKKITITYQHIFIKWENAAANPQIDADSRTPYYFSQGIGGGNYKENVTGIKGYQKIVYHNLYPGVDLEFSFHPGKGIEYAVKAKPGADASVFKMKYSGDLGLSFDDSHNLHIGSIIGDIIDHAPVVTSGGKEIPSAFQKTGNNEISFKFDNTTNSEIVIDPWTVFPITPVSWACDIAIDNADNTYVLEYSYPSAMLMYVQQYNPLGSLIWTYSLYEFTSTPFNSIEVDSSSVDPIYFSDFAVDPSGNSYVANPLFWANTFSGNTFGLVCLDSTGHRKYLDYSYSADSISETWNMAYSCADSMLVEGGCRVCCDHAQFDGVNLATGNPNLGEYADDAIGEIYAGTLAPNGNYYALSAIPGDAMTGPNNLLSGTVTKTHCSLNWSLNVTYPDIDYNSRETPHQLGTNGIVASCSYLYTSDGLVLDQRDLNTGALINTTHIPKGNNVSGTDNSGLGVDLGCGNVYAGSDSAIYVFDENLNLIGSYTTGIPGNIYGLTCNNGLVSACGDNPSGSGFVVQVAAMQCSSGITKTHTNATCTGNIGTASATATFCSGPYTYLWSPGGQTTQTITGLSAGVYTVTITPHGACFSNSDTINVGGPAALVSHTDASCSKDSSGTASVNISGGNSPFTYLWSNGATTQVDTGLTVGEYYVTVTDSSGCIFKDSVDIIKGNAPVIKVTPSPDSICYGNNVILTASGGKTYSWLPNSGLNCYTCPSPTASPTATTTYTISGVDSTGCSATTTVNVKVFSTPKPLITGKDSVCSGFTDTLSSSGGTTYVWSTGATTSSITKTITTNETFTVTAYNGQCFHDTTFTVAIVPTPTAVATATPDSVCQGDSVQLSAKGGVTYKWSTGNTSSSIWVKPATTTTYTLHAYAGTCSDTTTVNVKIAPATTATISPDDSICPGGTATLTATGSGGPVTYKWNTGETSSSISVSPGATTTYTATVFGLCDSVHVQAKVTVVPLPVPVITGTPEKCKGIKDTLTVSGGCSYKWNSGNTTAIYYTGAINSDSTIYVTVKNCFGCAVKDSFTVNVKAPPTVTFTNVIACAGECVTLTANASGSGLTYSWSNGATTDTTTVCPYADSTFSVTVSNGCAVKRSTTVSVYTPLLFACCDTTISSGESTILTANSSSTYSWVPTTGLNCDTCATVTATPSVTTIYTVTGTDAHGCRDSRTIEVKVEINCFNFTVPNVFTPNMAGPTGVNDEFYIKTENITNWSITIYDRWGKEMFNSTNPLAYWNGNTEGGSEAPDGVYYYILSGTCQSTTYKRDGFLQLIR